jgi:hypothetical protein
MAQIIKHRRGSISALKDVIANVGELVMATGSIGDFNGPVVFVGDTAVAGGYKAISKIYQGSSAPSISVGSHGSTMDGVPFYSTTDQTLYILDKSGNSAIDLTGNIEGNVISGVTINSLTGTRANITSVTGSNGNFTYLTGVTFTSTNGNITSLTSSYGNVTNLTGQTFTSTNSNITSLTGSMAKISNVTGGTLTVTGNTAMTGTLFVNDDVSINGDLYISGNTYQTGSIDITGDITLGGNITIGNQTTDIIQFGGEVSSSIVPIVNNAFDLGSPSNFWKDLYVSGTANVGILNANTISLSGITVFQDLIVSGSSYLGNGPEDNVIISGSIYNDALTNTRVLFAGVNGEIKDNSSFVYISGSGYLEAPIMHATDDGNGTNFLIGNDMWLGDINEGNATRFMGNEDNNYAKIYLGATSTNNYINADYDDVTLSANNVLSLQSQNSSVNIDSYDGDINLNTDSNNHISIGGETYINATTYVNMIYDYTAHSNYLQLYGTGTDDGFWWESGNGKDTTLINNENTSNLNILQENAGNVNISARQGSVNLSSQNGFNITGSTTLKDTLTVNSTSQLKGAVGMNSTLDVTGSATLKDTLTVNSTSQLKGAVGINSTLDVTGSVLLKDTLTVNSTSQLKGAVGINSTLDVTGSASLKGALTVTGTTTLNGDTYVTGLTQNRIVLAGSGGKLQDNNNLVFDTAKLQVGMGKFEVDVATGNIRTSGSLTVNSGMTINGDETVNGVLTVTGNTQLGGNLYVSGNLEVLGSSTNVNLQGHTVNIGDNIILVNAYSPFQQYAGLAAYDSGSSGTSGSLLWDSLNDYWMFVSTSGQSSKLIGTTAGTYGSEVNLTSGTFPIATANNTIGDSLLKYSGTTLSFNTNKFTIDSGTGDTLVSGNFTLSYSGGTDNGSKTSAIMFRNSSNVVGFVSTTETTDVMDGILGYKNSTGGLVFSTVIDGGTY